MASNARACLRVWNFWNFLGYGPQERIEGNKRQGLIHGKPTNKERCSELDKEILQLSQIDASFEQRIAEATSCGG